MKPAIAVAVAVWAGVAAATPAFGRDPEPQCPEMPPTADVERSRAGELSVQFGGVGLGGSRSRSRAANDVMIREGGFEAWSAAAVMAHACQVNRRLYRNDPARQRDYFIGLRERLLGRQLPASRAERPVATQPVSGSKGWTFAQLWQPLATYGFMPRTALDAGLNEGAAEVDCHLSRAAGLTDCRVISEWPSGNGFGAAITRYLGALQLREEPRRYSWSDRRVRQVVKISRYR